MNLDTAASIIKQVKDIEGFPNLRIIDMGTNGVLLCVGFAQVGKTALLLLRGFAEENNLQLISIKGYLIFSDNNLSPNP